MLAVVRYDRLADEPGDAEVAFLVEDAHQGRGVASVLLEHIAAAARERGLRRFVADVLPDNRRMTKVFRDAGYEAEQRFEDGVIRLTLDLEPTETSMEVTHGTRAPRRVPVDPAAAVPRARWRSSARAGAGHSVGQTVLRHLLQRRLHRSRLSGAPDRHGGRGGPGLPDASSTSRTRWTSRWWPYPPTTRARGRRAVRGQGRTRPGRGLRRASARPAPAGRARQEELVRLARAHGMRVVGPNCLGIANTDPASG